MRKKACAGLVVMALIVGSVAVAGDLVRLTTGVQAVYCLWQTSPPIYQAETYWGGIGIDLLYRSIKLIGLVTVADLETLRIEENPAVYFGIAMTYLRLGSVSLFAEGALLIETPLPNFTALCAGTGVSWSPLPFTSVHAYLAYETALSEATGSCIYFRFGVSAYLPLF